MAKISVIIVSWNVAGSLTKCLASLIQTNYPQLEIIVVDNASTDDSLAVARNFGNKIHLISNSQNLGFPRAINIGLRQATGEFIVLLNPDTRVNQDFFTKILTFFTTYADAGAMGPRFIDPDGSPQGSVFPEPSVINFIRQFWLNLGPSTEKYTPRTNDPVAVNSISGGCFIMPRSTLTKVGMLTEQVFMYYEDLDYCRRIRKSGLKIYYNPYIEIIHEHGQSSKQSPKSLTYFKSASRWYNGIIKDKLLWFISWSGQKLHSKSH